MKVNQAPRRAREKSGGLSVFVLRNMLCALCLGKKKKGGLFISLHRLPEKFTELYKRDISKAW